MEAVDDGERLREGARSGIKRDGQFFGTGELAKSGSQMQGKKRIKE